MRGYGELEGVMARWRAAAGIGWLVTLALLAGAAPAAAPQAPSGELDPAYLDRLLAPVALYPDQLLAQILLCSGNPRKVGELDAWLKQGSALKGSELQQAAEQAGFEPSFVALAPFPQVVELMAGNLTWTSQLGGAFATDRGGVFDAIQRLRKQGQATGNLKSTPQQTVETKTTQGGEQVIVIEPANPQVVYVPQYNPQVVYTQPTTIVVHEDDDDEVAAAVIGFTAGVAIGAAFSPYYYGPYGWRGGAYMYNDGWDDWYDDREDMREDYYENREDAREDWQDNREDLAGERSDRAEDAREQRGERAEGAQQQRSDRQEARGSSEAQAQREQRRSEAQGRAQEARSTETTPARTSTQSAAAERGSRERSTSAERSGTRSDAFSGYSSGSSTRSERSRGERSRSRSSGGRSRRR
jgi:Protein of unknown function (DUF3300)